MLLTPVSAHLVTSKVQEDEALRSINYMRQNVVGGNRDNSKYVISVHGPDVFFDMPCGRTLNQLGTYQLVPSFFISCCSMTNWFTIIHQPLSRYFVAFTRTKNYEWADVNVANIAINGGCNGGYRSIWQNAEASHCWQATTETWRCAHRSNQRIPCIPRRELASMPVKKVRKWMKGS